MRCRCLRATGSAWFQTTGERVCRALQEGPATMSTPRRAKSFLTVGQKYDLSQRLLTGQITTVQAAAKAAWTARRSRPAQDGPGRGKRRPAGVTTGSPQGGPGRGVRVGQ